MILQFGTGNFLRAFADVFVEELDRENAMPIGPVIAVQSTGRERADAINAAQGRYHVAIQGFRDGRVVDETMRASSLCEALYTGTQWNRVLNSACRSDLVAIISNTTEAGLALDERDGVLPTSESDANAENQVTDLVYSGAPHSFPAKLLECLRVRFDAGQPGCWIVPCELVEANGDRLRELLVKQSRLWKLNHDLIHWIETECHWVNTLVDRIVPGPPKSHPLLGVDPLLISCEPFAFWAVETERADFPFARHPAVTLAPDITPYTLRKVRILNGAHTALVAKALHSDLRTVGDCMNDPETSAWLERLLFEEIVPTLEGRCEDPAGFARAALDRFRNPFLDHALSSIALHHDAKIKTRLRPTLREFRERFGKEPPLLSALLE